MYNILSGEDFAIAEYRVPLATFVEMLEDRDIPDEIAVSGLGQALEDDDTQLEAMKHAMRAQRDWLDSRPTLPVIQFIVSGDLQETGNGYELYRAGEYYPLQPLFGRNISRREPGWLVTSFRV